MTSVGTISKMEFDTTFSVFLDAAAKCRMIATVSSRGADQATLAAGLRMKQKVLSNSILEILPTDATFEKPKYNLKIHFRNTLDMLGMNDIRQPVNESGPPGNEVELPENDTRPPNNEHEQPNNDPGRPENESESPENEPRQLANEPGPLENERGLHENEPEPLENEPEPIENELERPDNERRPPINESASPTHVVYVSLEERLDTFWSWPISLEVQPENLYKAGFFYTGKSDRTVCFHCGVEICDWVESDDPWCEHAKWAPNCPYLLQEKGRGFVENVLRNQKTPSASKDLKKVKAPAEQKEPHEIDHAIPSTSRSANGSAADSRPDVSKGAVKKTGYCAGFKDDGGKGSMAKALGSSFSESESHDEDNDIATPKRSESQKGNGIKMDDVSISDNSLCKICWQEQLSVAFLPCGHLIACVKCATALEKCAVCCQHFTATVRVYLP